MAAGSRAEESRSLRPHTWRNVMESATSPSFAVNRSQRMVAALLITVAVVVVVWGGYGQGWSWTGLTANATLWAWLKLLALPLALATLPLWLRSHSRMAGTRRGPLIAAAAGFAVFAFLAYWLQWAWTGFAGNTLWDWFEVLLLPVVVVTVKFWTAERTIQPWHRWLLALLVAVLPSSWSSPTSCPSAGAASRTTRSSTGCGCS